MFVPGIAIKHGSVLRTEDMEPFLPTSPQAEVQCYERIGLEYIQEISCHKFTFGAHVKKEICDYIPVSYCSPYYCDSGYFNLRDKIKWEKKISRRVW